MKKRDARWLQAFVTGCQASSAVKASLTRSVEAINPLWTARICWMAVRG